MPARLCLSLLAVLCLGALAPGAAGAAPSPGVRVKVLTKEGSSLAKGGLRVRVRVRRAGTVKVAGAATGGRSFRGRTLRFRRAGARNVLLRRRGASAAALGCEGPRVRASARFRPARARARRRAQRRPPAFTGRTRIARTARTLAGDRSKCYRVGLASRSIAPSPNGSFAGGAVNLGGYGLGSVSGRSATGILGGGPKVAAFAVSDGKRSFAIADMDVQGWFTANKDGPLGIVDMRKEVERRTGGALKASEVVIQSNHSHGGADAIGVWGGVPIEFRRFMFDRTVEAIVEAQRTVQPAALHYGTANGFDLLSNQFAYDEANKSLDSDVRVLQARSPTGKTLATFLNFSAHTTVLGSSNRKITGDWTQAATSIMESRFGGEAITVVATLGRTQPARADCRNKSLKGEAADTCKINDYGGRVVDRAQKAIEAAKPIPGNPVVAATSFLIQDVGNNGVILGLNYAGDPAGAPVNRSLTPPWLAGNVLGTVTSSVRIGDVLLSTFPGEAYPQIPLTIRQLVPGLRGYMTAGLAQDQLGYLIAPFESYPEPIRRTFFNQRGDEVDPISNDNYAFNVSMTLGERIICSSLRGAGEVFGRGLEFRRKASRCDLFFNDLNAPPGADTAG